MNDIFIPYNNKHKDESCFIFGTGPSLTLFKDSKYFKEFKNGISIGVNEIVYYEIIMDYYFIGDPGNKHKGFNKNPQKYIDYQANIAKFFRSNKQVAQHIPQLPQNLNGVSYYTTTGWSFTHPKYRNKPKEFNKNIVDSMLDSGTIILEALQFALYCGFSKIHLVGCDCNYSNGTFKTSKNQPTHLSSTNKLENFMHERWVAIKDFIDAEYPQAKIITINPVGMDLFNDKI